MVWNSSVVYESLAEVLATVLDIAELECTVSDGIEFDRSHFFLDLRVAYGNIGFGDDPEVEEPDFLHHSSEILQVESAG